MKPQNELREFLTTRRNRITPAQAGLGPTMGRRRVPGLRRDEVAALAKVSVEYYTRLEQGNAKGASEEVLHAVATALQLDDTERNHLFDLTRALGPALSRKRKPKAPGMIRPGIQALLDSMSDTAAVISNERTDILAANALGRALYADILRSAGQPPNHARFLFLDPVARSFHRDWDTSANNAVALLRAAAGRNPFDKDLTELVGELSTRSEEFRALWASHDVRRHTTGIKRFHHHDVGDLDVNYENFTVDADEGLSLLTYYAEPGTPAHDALRLLATLSSTAEHAATNEATGPTR